MLVFVGITAVLTSLTYVVLSSQKPAALDVALVPRPQILSRKPLPVEPQPGLPIRLKIPKIAVDASIVNMGLTAAGDMDTPGNLVDVGWYKYGPQPGDKGSAVIAGHLGVQGPGVFANLKLLQKGDRLLIVDDKGQIISFVVAQTRTYNFKEHPSEVFNNNDGVHLNLITCTGVWIQSQRTFTNRLVVFADKSS